MNEKYMEFISPKNSDRMKRRTEVTSFPETPLHEICGTMPTIIVDDEIELRLKKAEDMRQTLINRAQAHDAACRYASDFFDLSNQQTITYLLDPSRAPQKVLVSMLDDGLATVYRCPTRRGKESIWPVYYAKFVTEVLKLNGVNADVSVWDEFEMNQIVDTFNM